MANEKPVIASNEKAPDQQINEEALAKLQAEEDAANLAAEEKKEEAPPADDKKEEVPAPGKVKVKILMHVGPHAPGDVVEMDAETAKALCKPQVGSSGFQGQQKAALLSDVQKFSELPVDISKMTQADMNRLGIKNVVQSPEYKAQQSKLAEGSIKANKDFGKPNQAPTKTNNGKSK